MLYIEKPLQYIKSRLLLLKLYNRKISKHEANRGARTQSVTVKSTGCGFDSHSRKWNIYLHFYFHFFALVSRESAALSSATQWATPPELGGKWGTESLNTRFPLPTLLRAGYSVKLIFLFRNIFKLPFTIGVSKSCKF